MHTAALAAAGIPGSYVARRVDEAGMAEAAAEMRSDGIDGANVTMPHKRTAHALADRLSPGAERAGSVNTWVRSGQTIEGFSTDIDGVRRVWEERLSSGELALILGAGGAAAAALVALEGIHLAISARRPESAQAVASRVGVDAAVVEWGEPIRGAVLVNATPLGMNGEVLPDAVVEEASGLLEMAYGPVETPAVRRARQAGLQVADGLDLLVAQAEESFRLWTGAFSAPGVMEAAARKNSRHPGEGPNHS